MRYRAVWLWGSSTRIKRLTQRDGDGDATVSWSTRRKMSMVEGMYENITAIVVVGEGASGDFDV